PHRTTSDTPNTTRIPPATPSTMSGPAPPVRNRPARPAITDSPAPYTSMHPTTVATSSTCSTGPGDAGRNGGSSARKKSPVLGFVSELISPVRNTRGSRRAGRRGTIGASGSAGAATATAAVPDPSPDPDPAPDPT